MAVSVFIRRGCSYLVSCVVFLSMAAAAELRVEDAYVRGLPPGQPVTAAFMRIINTADRAVEVIAASTDSAKLAEIHVHRHHNGMMSMEKVDSITIPAGGEFVLAPGGYHLMLIDLYKPLREGEMVSIKLQMTGGDSNNGDVLVMQAPVRSVLNER